MSPLRPSWTPKEDSIFDTVHLPPPILCSISQGGIPSLGRNELGRPQGHLTQVPPSSSVSLDSSNAGISLSSPPTCGGSWISVCGGPLGEGSDGWQGVYSCRSLFVPPWSRALILWGMVRVPLRVVTPLNQVLVGVGSPLMLNTHIFLIFLLANKLLHLFQILDVAMLTYTPKCLWRWVCPATQYVGYHILTPWYIYHC